MSVVLALLLTMQAPGPCGPGGCPPAGGMMGAMRPAGMFSPFAQGGFMRPAFRPTPLPSFRPAGPGGFRGGFFLPARGPFQPRPAGFSLPLPRNHPGRVGAAGGGMHQGHNCPRCGTVVTRISGGNPAGRHSHTCPRCGTSWSH